MFEKFPWFSARQAGHDKGHEVVGVEDWFADEAIGVIYEGLVVAGREGLI